MSSFKDFVRSDLNTFFNADELAELHTLDGVEMMAIVDSDGFEEFSGRSVEIENAMQGIFTSSVTLFVKSSDYEKPNVGYRLKLDGEYYYVTGASEAAGLVKINLIAHES
ncbi:hypothetical protein [Desulfitobacterium chlororespirans]|uniref:ATP-binding sugar transporter n=1 Tax=Desulfitobacterium chlororespirans DSM 11544 TaxID=1121395 RepID=A0A1M7U2U1_9FIRM|nr:hypothetical protein [Desulfitobacterium chlororespirans]SHN77278.1 ATP-binding sugar transporter [Desulfitobacterium chlororespirans DSM 11544]